MSGIDWTAIIVGILSLLGTAGGSIVSVITANRLTNYKIEELRKEVEKHNKVVERVYALEKGVEVMDEKIKVANHRIEDLERKAEVKK